MREMTVRTMQVFAIGMFGALGLSPAVFAADGIIEINQVAAFAGGVTAGDAAGFPVTISQPGSYLLTSNLTVTSENTTAIAVEASDVTIDLNGFAILGATTCSVLGGCTGAGTGNGVSSLEGSPPYPSTVTVRNGTIRGMGDRGIELWDNSRIEGVSVSNNGDDGINVGPNSVVSDNTSSVNGGTGIFTSNGSVVTHNTTVSNTEDGIFAAQGSTVSFNTARANIQDGIDVNNGSLVTGNGAWQNVGDGIEAGPGSTVTNNAAHDNNGYGLNLSAGAGYSDNVLTDNNAGQVTAAGVQIGTNLCGTNTTCP